MAPPRPWGGRSSAPNFTERLWASSSVAKAVRLTTQFCDNIEGHNSYVDAALLGLKVTACTVGHLAIVTVNRLIGMDNLDRWASRMLDEIMYIADPSTRHSVECKGKVHQGSKDNEDEVIVPIREMVKAEGKHKEKILQNEHTIIHKGTSSEHKHGFAGCPEGTQENKVTEQSELSRNHCNVEEIQREDIEVATGAKGGCGSARLSGDVVEAGETHRKGCVMGGAETKGDTEKLGEKKPNTEELTLYRKFMDREENADDRVISTKNDTGIEAISENKTEKGEFTEKEFERESERVAEVTDETDVTENKDDAAVVSENKNEAEEVAEDTNKTKDMKENENETEEVMKNSNRAEQVVENKIITESKAEAEQVAATQAEAEQVAATQAEAEQVAATQAEAEQVAATQAEAEQVAATQAEAEQVAATQAEAEQAAGNKLDRERENNNETDDIKEHKAAFGHPEIASDFKRGGSAVDGARPGPTSAPKKSSAADGTANVGGAGRKNKKKNSRRKK